MENLRIDILNIVKNIELDLSCIKENIIRMDKSIMDGDATRNSIIKNLMNFNDILETDFSYLDEIRKVLGR